MVMGARQVGKTTLVRAFAAQEYDSLAEVNFLGNTTAIETLSGATDANDLMLRLSVLTGKALESGKTLLFLDEMQECGDMLTWVKFLAERADLDVVLSGSLLGLDAYVQARSLPVGFLRKTTLYPLTFEEFARARGITAEVWAAMEDAVLSRAQVPDFIHARLSALFREYLLVGGMPDAVQAFVDTSQIVPTRGVQRDILDLYESDIVKYVGDALEARQIKMVYEAIPSQLNAPTKRFKYRRLDKNLRFANLETAFDWLVSAGIAIEATRVGQIAYPLGFSEDRSSLKLFYNDVGLLTSQLMGNVDLEIVNGRTNINYGSVFEAVVAQELAARGFALHYYSSKKRGEVDFAIEDSATGKTRAIEVKSGKDYRRHSALTSLLDAGDVQDALVLYDGNVEVERGRVYAPAYAASLAMQI
ncbi:MAG: AAA family ATPase [Eggerthellaceae bacterium]|nr:AAA family ATPase [Eggerthellaceae bacterium]